MGNVEHLISLDQARVSGLRDDAGGAMPSSSGSGAVTCSMMPEVAQDNERIYIVEYKRDPSEFHDKLQKNEAFKPYRDALAEKGLPFQSASGAYMLVHAHQHQAAIDAINDIKGASML